MFCLLKTKAFKFLVKDKNREMKKKTHYFITSKRAVSFNYELLFILKYSCINVRPAVRQLKLGQKWVMQQGNDGRHSRKSPQNG